MLYTLRIAKLCGISSRTTVIKILTRLTELGLITTVKRFTKQGGKSSNEYIINDLPSPPCSKNEHTHVQEMNLTA
ncbi:hypothetical protein QUF74_19415 [Candidatus Halobeggiatoa sp. HSG11]|nr:hypothetical protein [Candidatus Halobeggiatoa sp. HSG11]